MQDIAGANQPLEMATKSDDSKAIFAGARDGEQMKFELEIDGCGVDIPLAWDALQVLYETPQSMAFCLD